MKGGRLPKRHDGQAVSFDTLRSIADGDVATQPQQQQPPPPDGGAAEDREAAGVRLEIVLTHIAFRLLHEKRCPRAARALEGWQAPRGVTNRGLFSGGGHPLRLGGPGGRDVDAPGRRLLEDRHDTL